MLPSVIIALLGGLLTTAAFAPFQVWPAVVLGPMLLLWALRGRTPRQALLVGGAFGFAHFLSGVWWVLISTWVYGGAPLSLSLLLLLILSVYLCLYPALGAGLLVWLYPRVIGAWSLLLWPACWLVAEFARDTLFDGFPWFSLGYVATEVPQGLKLVALLGVHGVSAVYALVAAALMVLLLGPGRIWAALALVAVLAVHIGSPMPRSWTQPAGEPIDAVLIQGNMSQDQKWRPENRLPTIELYEHMTEQAWPADLVIWPEAAIPMPYDYVTWLFDSLDHRAREAGGTLYAGILTQKDGATYNTVYALGEDQGRYVKQHLVPFGEYIPAPPWIRPMFDVLNLPFPSIAVGLDGQRTLDVNGHAVSMSICFEDVFPMEVRETSRSAGLLVNVTNDAWFSGSAAPHQHLQIARLRAAESGRSLLRVANTGISAVIGPDGNVEQQLDWGVRGSLRAQVTPRDGETPYQRWGRLPLLIYMVSAIALALLMRRRLLTYRAFFKTDL